MGFIDELEKLNNRAELESDLNVNDIETVYHYTDITGLKGILGEGGFRVSHSYFMNDINELMYTIEVIVSVIDELKIKETDLEIIKMYNLLLEDAKNYIIAETDETWLSRRSGHRRPSEYILSFSLDNDSLQVWSSFTGGCGYNIGLDFSKFKDKLNKEYNKELNEEAKVIYIFSKVIYDRSKQEEIIKRKIAEYKEIYCRYADQLSESEIKSFTAKFFIGMRLFACFFKNPVFCGDNEFRVVFFNYSHLVSYIKPEFRTKNGMLIPYFDIFKRRNGNSTDEPNQLPVNSITIGPTNFSDMAKEGVYYYLYDLDYDIEKIEVRNSKIPLRY